MATLTLADRVAETTTTTGTGTLSLDGARDGSFRTFVAGAGNAAVVPYVIVHRTANEWEVGYGTVTDATPDTLSRTAVYSSSNSGALVSFSAGTKDVFLSLPAGRTSGRNTDGQTQVSAGTAALPSIVDPSDPNTGVFFPAADTLAEATGGTERRRTTAQGYFKASSTGTYNGATDTYHELRGSAAGLMAVFTNTATVGPDGMVVQFTAAAPNNTSQYFYRGLDNIADRAYIYSNGTFGSATNTYGAIVSERRFKQDIQDIGSQWSDIKAIRLRKFRFIKDVEANPDEPLQLGVIIDELEQVSPGLITETPVYGPSVPALDAHGKPVLDADGNPKMVRGPQIDTHKGWKTSVALLKAMGALQEAMARIESLEARLKKAGI